MVTAVEHSEQNLASYAAHIRAEYALAEESQQRAVTAYRQIGRDLIEAKDLLRHGEWLPWLRANVPFSVRQADRYMRLAKLDVTSNLDDAWGAILGNDEPEEPVAHNHRAQGTGENEWYTPGEVLEVARAVLGAFDLDPASSAVAQKSVRAGAHFTQADDGLSREWFGRVWLNPPYSQPAIRHFVEKLVAEYQSGRVSEAILLTHSYTDTAWFQGAAAAAAAVCFTRGRIAFVSPTGEKAAPTQGQAFAYFGANVDGFRDQFSALGLVLKGVSHG